MLANTIPVSAAPSMGLTSLLLMRVPDSKPRSHLRTVISIHLPDLFGANLKKLLRRAARMAEMAERQICMKL